MKEKQKSFVRKLYRQFLVLLLLCANPLSMTAQSRVVTGEVVDADNLPMIGVAVVIKGTSNGSITDLDGKYSLNVTGEKPILVFSFIGFTTKEIAVENQSVINTMLTEDVKSLDEVVVIGYGVQKKSHLTGSISKVKVNELSDVPTSRIDQALQGKIAGVQINNTTSEAGAAP